MQISRFTINAYVVAVVTVAGLAVTGAAHAPAVEAPEAPAVVETVQVVTAPITEPAPVEVAPVEAVRVETPIVEEDAPYTPSTEDCGPDGYRIEAGTCEWYVDTPTICEPGLILVEDGSCVPPEFFTEVGGVGATYTLEPCIEEDGSGQVACYWDAATRANGEGTSFVMLEGIAFYPEG